jgi:hypothetical protein
MNNDSILLQGGFATLILEALKWFIYTPLTNLIRWVFKKPDFIINVPVWFYLILLPVLNFLAVPALALAGFSGFILPADPVEFAREVLRLVITSALSVLIYNGGLKPTKEKLAS